MSFYICHCGFPENNHYFKHKYENLIKVERKDNSFLIDVNDYPVKTTIVCGIPQCKMQKSLHKLLFTKELDNETKVTHEFTPEEKKFREINFMIPEDAICHSCNSTLSQHREIRSSNENDFVINIDLHNFVANIIFQNKTNSDIIKVFDETRGMKIVLI